MKKLFLFSLLLHAFILPIYANEVATVDFDDSMRKCYKNFDQHGINTNVNANWKFSRDLFTDYRKRKIKKKADYIIPKRIHLIWLGSRLPERCQKVVDSWKKFHPKWDLKVWTDEDVAHFGMQNKAAFDKAINWGEKSDIWRYEILYRYGGIYIDTDFECLKPFDLIHKSTEFYAGICYEQIALLGNSLIGSVPKHPILARCIQQIQVGPGDNDADRIQRETGPYHFTRCFMDAAQLYSRKVVVFPTSYFFPLPPGRIDVANAEEAKKQYVQPESFAIHYWATSWCK